MGPCSNFTGKFERDYHVIRFETHWHVWRSDKLDLQLGAGNPDYQTTPLQVGIIIWTYRRDTPYLLGPRGFKEIGRCTVLWRVAMESLKFITFQIP